jgi:hypothetical protein
MSRWRMTHVFREFCKYQGRCCGPLEAALIPAKYHAMRPIELSIRVHSEAAPPVRAKSSRL